MSLRENIVDIERYRGMTSEPLLLLVDLQREFIADGRRLQISSIGTALENCRRLLAHARANRWVIAHVRWMQRGMYFNRAMPFSSWIEGFEPRATELVYDKIGPSCYSAPDFAAMMDAGSTSYTLLAGFTGAVSCLSTIVEGATRNHDITLVKDASASHAFGNCDEWSAHAQACFIAAHHGGVTTTSEVIDSEGGSHVTFEYQKRPRL